MAHNVTETPTFSEFKADFHPEVQIDDYYQRLHQDNGFEIIVDPQDLALFAYAVNPFGFNDKKDRPLNISIGDLSKKPTLHGRYSKNKASIEVFRYSGISEEIRNVDFLITRSVQKSYSNSKLMDDVYGHLKVEQDAAPTPTIANLEIEAMNETLIHEMQHAADSINNARFDVSYIAKISAASGIISFSVYHGVSTALSEIYQSLPEGLNTDDTISTAASIGKIAIPTAAALAVHLRLFGKQKIYLNNPGEIKARQAEKVSPYLPQPIKIIPAS